MNIKQKMVLNDQKNCSNDQNNSSNEQIQKQKYFKGPKNSLNKPENCLNVCINYRLRLGRQANTISWPSASTRTGYGAQRCG